MKPATGNRAFDSLGRPERSRAATGRPTTLRVPTQRRHRLIAACLLIALTAVVPSAQRRPTIAAAANLNFALAEIARQFEQEHGTGVELVFGSSGTLARQIRYGAPFEMFLAADEEFPNQLTAAGLTRDAGEVYSVGRLVIFAPKGSPLKIDERLEGLERLVRAGGVTRFAIANPEVAPYGRAAEAALRRHGLWDALRPHLVLGDSISQAAQFATTGNAVGGLIAYSLVLTPAFADRGTYALISETDHPPLRQRMVLLKQAGPIATRFYAFLRTDAARATLRKHGFSVPD